MATHCPSLVARKFLICGRVTTESKNLPIPAPQPWNKCVISASKSASHRRSAPLPVTSRAPRASRLGADAGASEDGISCALSWDILLMSASAEAAVTPRAANSPMKPRREILSSRYRLTRALIFLVLCCFRDRLATPGGTVTTESGRISSGSDTSNGYYAWVSERTNVEPSSRHRKPSNRRKCRPLRRR